ncbi:MAG TPA: hypothetical protein VFI02_19305 [Armatimonadota bacterium]|nr:hypothetical protein [Armatimonadota bacterium]
MRRFLTVFVCLVLFGLPALSQSSNPADWPREIIEGLYALIDYQVDRTNVVGLINFEQACSNWQLNYKAASGGDAYEAVHPIPVPPNRAVRGEVRVDPSYGTYTIPFVVFEDEPIAAPCERPSRPVAPEGAYGFGPPVDVSEPFGNLLIRWPTTIAAGSIRQNPENGRNYRLVVKTYGSFKAQWWEPVS